MKHRVFIGGLFDGHTDIGEPDQTVVLAEHLAPVMHPGGDGWSQAIHSEPLAVARYVLVEEWPKECRYEPPKLSY